MKRIARIAAVALAGMTSPLAAETWAIDANGVWGVPTNWLPTSVPNGVDASAILGTTITAPRSITLDVPVTVGSISVLGGRDYTLIGTEALSFDVSTGQAGVTVNSNGDLIVTTDVVLNDDLLVNTVTPSDSVLRVTGNISGSGGITKTGGGALILDGTNTYSGPTVVQAGRLQANSASLPGDVTNNALLVFTQTVDGTYAGVISGSGNVIKTGNGTLTLGGANSYTGNTTVAGNGALVATTSSLPGTQIRTVTSTTPGGAVLTSSLIFDQSFNGSFAGAITGDGAFVKRGSGEVVLTGANTFTGVTTVEAGTLSVDSSLAGPLTVQSGARLAGNGTIAAPVTILTDGIIAPGRSIGTLTVASLSFGGRYEVDYRAPGVGAPLISSGAGQSLRGQNSVLDPGLPAAAQDADLLVVAGAANLGPSATIVLQPSGTAASFQAAFNQAGNTNNQIQYLVLRAGNGLTGRFVALSSSGATLDYRSAGGAAEDVWLLLTDPSQVVLTGSAPAPYVLPPETARPRCDIRGGPGEMCAILEGDLLSFDQDADGAVPGTSSDGGAGLVGIARTFESGLQAGLAFSYRDGDLELTDGTGRGDLARQGGILWAEWTDGAIDLRGWFGLGFASIDSRRDTALGATARADIDATDVSLSLEARRWFDTAKGFAVSPLLGLGLGRVWQDGYSETGAGPEDFSAQDTSWNNVSSLIGVELRTDGLVSGRRYEFTAGLGWQHEWADTSTTIGGTYAGDVTGTVLWASSPSAERDRLALDLGGTLWLSDATALHVRYGLSHGGDLTDQVLGFRLSASF